jgi:hypothetical protein
LAKMVMGRQGAVSVTPFGEGREKGLQADEHPAEKRLETDRELEAGKLPWSCYWRTGSQRRSLIRTS